MTAKPSWFHGEIQIATAAIMMVNLDPATIGGKLSFRVIKSGNVSLTCVGVGVKLPATKLPSPNSVEGSLRMTRSDEMDQGVLSTLML